MPHTFKYNDHIITLQLIKTNIVINLFPRYIGGDSTTAENVLKQCVEVLERIMSDDAVPRNIRRSAENVKSILMNESTSEAIKAASAISILDEISNDPNIPLHTRTLVWNVASQLETIPVA